MREYKVRLTISVYNPLMNDIDLERAIKSTLEADSDIYIKTLI